MIRAREALGFEKVRWIGSHARFHHPGSSVVIVPVHSGQDIGRGLLQKILRDAQVTPAEFLEALNG
ncbi:MAG: addiction module toxin, HicA family [SAR202 cluster bacterium]|nr:type II toxin-antitoxin system HicA family toxin [Dehalococcoidia bacterium]MQF87849.1 addiction module toxin, HicA family [SAR202 cluster bacterium]